MHTILESLIQDGTSEPFVLVMPSDGLWGDGSGYVTHDSQDFEKWIGQEVPEVINQTIEEVSAESKYFISGLSMGGYGAFRVGLRYADTYSAISAHSSITHTNQLETFVEEDWSSWNERNDGSLLTLFRNHDNFPQIRFDCGTEDSLLEHNRQLHKGLDEAMISHEYQEFPGGHDWSYWQEHIRNTFSFFSRV